MSGTQYASGYIEAGTAQNVICGFRPSSVVLTDLTDRAIVWKASLDRILEFDSGGSATQDRELKAGYRIDASAGWSATISQVVLTGGSWAGSNATGFLVLVPGSLVGGGNVADGNTVRSSGETIDVAPFGNWASLDNGAGGPLLGTTVEMKTTFAGTSEITPYDGTEGGFGVGFSIVAGVGTAADLLKWEAWGSNNDGE